MLFSSSTTTTHRPQLFGTVSGPGFDQVPGKRAVACSDHMPLTLSDILRHSVSYASYDKKQPFSLLAPSVDVPSKKLTKEQPHSTVDLECCSNKSQSCPHRPWVPHVPPTAVAAARQLSKRSPLPRTTHPPPAQVTPLSTAARTAAQVPHPGNARRTAQSANAAQCRPHHPTTTISRQRQQQGRTRLRRRKRKRVERAATAKRYRSLPITRSKVLSSTVP